VSKLASMPMRLRQSFWLGSETVCRQRPMLQSTSVTVLRHTGTEPGCFRSAFRPVGETELASDRSFGLLRKESPGSGSSPAFREKTGGTSKQTFAPESRHQWRAFRWMPC
jgi:hypothetical protein